MPERSSVARSIPCRHSSLRPSIHSVTAFLLRLSQSGSAQHHRLLCQWSLVGLPKAGRSTRTTSRQPLRCALVSQLGQQTSSASFSTWRPRQHRICLRRAPKHQGVQQRASAPSSDRSRVLPVGYGNGALKDYGTVIASDRGPRYPPQIRSPNNLPYLINIPMIRRSTPIKPTKRNTQRRYR